MSFMTAKGITAGYGKKKIIENISFELEQGSVMGVLGANGSGKTTLLKALCGILPHEGYSVIDGIIPDDLGSKQIAKLVSYIPQRSGISIDISALDVVLMGYNYRLGILEHPTNQMKARAIEVLAQVGLCGREEENYLHLSEGQKQLCILARTLVSDSRLLLLDEPESALDFNFRHRMVELICSFVKGENRSAVVTLHDPLLALNFCDKILLLDGGKVLAIIEPGKDDFDDMEQKLSRVYGQISLQKCLNRKGESITVMLREE